MKANHVFVVSTVQRESMVSDFGIDVPILRINFDRYMAFKETLKSSFKVL
jgi:hypothetical protein